MIAEGAGEAALSVVLVSAPPDRAESIARAILEARLAACVNVVPGVGSLYWWQGAIARDEESMLVVKTRTDLVPALTAAIRAAHPYEVPEVLALPVTAGIGNPAYHAWVVESVAVPPEG